MKESITTGVTEMEKTVNNNMDDASLAQAKQVLIWATSRENLSSGLSY